VFLISAVEQGFHRFTVALNGDDRVHFIRLAAADDGQADARRRDLFAALAKMGAKEVHEHRETAEAFEDAAHAALRRER
jgi:hypothetical protein